MFLLHQLKRRMRASYPTLRTAHFLKPSLTSIDAPAPVSGLPSTSLLCPPPHSQPKKIPLKVNLNGWKYPQKNWKNWVYKMHPLYQSVWKEAGIHDAVLNSTYTIKRHNNLFLGFAERWSSETKTFVFSMGKSFNHTWIYYGFKRLLCFNQGKKIWGKEWWVLLSNHRRFWGTWLCYQANRRWILHFSADFRYRDFDEIDIVFENWGNFGRRLMLLGPGWKWKRFCGLLSSDLESELATFYIWYFSFCPRGLFGLHVRYDIPEKHNNSIGGSKYNQTYQKC